VKESFTCRSSGGAIADLISPLSNAEIMRFPCTTASGNGAWDELFNVEETAATRSRFTAISQGQVDWTRHDARRGEGRRNAGMLLGGYMKGAPSR
jgi:hypothetical protein